MGQYNPGTFGRTRCWLWSKQNPAYLSNVNRGLQKEARLEHTSKHMGTLNLPDCLDLVLGGIITKRAHQIFGCLPLRAWCIFWPISERLIWSSLAFPASSLRYCHFEQDIVCLANCRYERSCHGIFRSQYQMRRSINSSWVHDLWPVRIGVFLLCGWIFYLTLLIPVLPCSVSRALSMLRMTAGCSTLISCRDGMLYDGAVLASRGASIIMTLWYFYYREAE
jgi:hypothetical protein